MKYGLPECHHKDGSEEDNKHTNDIIESIKVQTWIMTDQIDFKIHNERPTKKVLSMHGN